jgi:hypothetical protein
MRELEKYAVVPGIGGLIRTSPSPRHPSLHDSRLVLLAILYRLLLWNQSPLSSSGLAEIRVSINYHMHHILHPIAAADRYWGLSDQHRIRQMA